MKQMQENNKQTIQLESDEKFSYSILNDQECIREVKGSDTFSIINDANKSF